MYGAFLLSGSILCATATLVNENPSHKLNTVSKVWKKKYKTECSHRTFEKSKPELALVIRKCKAQEGRLSSKAYTKILLI
jgi:hypothetical protein